jgi:crossover junction endodeoxyribonuclease RusA
MTTESDSLIRVVFVPGKPIPEGSTTAYVRGGHANTTHANARVLRPWRAEIHAVIRAATPERTIDIPTGPVAVVLTFLMPRRTAEPKRSTPPHTRKPDLDKLIRAVMDAMTGVVYADDAQVIHVAADKRTAAIGEQPGVLIRWWER